MKKKDYKLYSFEDFLLDEEFVRWTIDPDNALNYYWQNVIANYPEQQSTIKKARELILIFHFQQENGTTEERQKVLGNILKRQLAESDKNSIEEKSNRIVNLPYFSRVAAVLIFLIGSIFMLNNLLEQPSTTNISESKAETITKATQSGQKLLIRLPDGTSVHLNAESSISYPQQFAENYREVQFSGEAFFDVVKDSSRPFLINTERITTKVLGTSFNLKSYPGNDLFSVALVTGKVKVLSNSNIGNLSEDLLPNQKITVNKNSLESNTTSFNSITETGWKDGILVFDNNTYQEAFAKLERWYGVKVDLLNAPKEQWQLKGKFDDMSLKQVMENLKFTHNLNFELHEKNLKVKF